jgi:RHS repeat-associated protein
MYMQARYYDPVIGRFYSNDPVDALGHMQRGNNPAHGFNRYAYANNNPYKYTDPDGEFIHLAVGFAVGFAAEIGAQALQGKELNFTKAAVSGVAGAVTGGVSAFAKTSLTVGGKIVASSAEKVAAGTLVAGSTATSAAGASAVNDSLSGTSAGQIVDNAIEAAVESVIPQGKVVGKVAGDAVSAVTKKLGASDSITQGASDVASSTASNVLNDQCRATNNSC